MIALVVNMVAAMGLTVAAFYRPGFGIGVALVLGRHTFPDRVTPIVAAAPLLCVASAFGYWASGRRLQVTPVIIAACGLCSAVVLAGGLRGSTNDLVREVADDKSFFMLAAVVPLMILTGALRDRDVRVDCFRAIIVVSFLLTLVMLATSGGEREGALGGGPITLAMSIGMSLIILIHHHDPLLPTEIQPFETAIRAVVGFVFLVGIWLTESRQPVFSLLLVLGVATIVGLSRDAHHATSSRQLRRIRRLRFGSTLATSVAAVALYQLVFGGGDSRFTLLADPGKEIARSRSFVWDAGLKKISTGGLWGHGFGATITADAPEIVYYPHNLFIELMAEVGPLVTLVCTAGLLAAAVTAATTGNRVFALLASYSFLGAQFSGDLYNSRYLFVFLLASIVVAPAVRPHPEPEPDEWRPEPDHVLWRQEATS